MGIAVLGNYDRGVAPTADSVQAVTDHLAWEAQRHGIEPEGSSTYGNPVNGVEKDVANISAHRDWVSTACPGKHLCAKLPEIRSGASAAIVADTGDVAAPAPPTGLTVTPGDTSVALDWADSPEPDLAQYAVERSTDGGGTWSPLWSGPDSRHDDTGLTNGSTYHYRVTATDGSGNVSGPSEVAWATPAAATTATATETVSAVTLDKGATSEDGLTELSADDGEKYDVSTVRQGRQHVTQWTAQIQLDPSSIAGLVVRLAAPASSTTTRVLSVYDPSTATWTDVDTVSVVGEDVVTEWTAGDLGVVSSAGELPLRVRTSASSSSVTSADLLHAEVTRTS